MVEPDWLGKGHGVYRQGQKYRKQVLRLVYP